MLNFVLLVVSIDLLFSYTKKMRKLDPRYGDIPSDRLRGKSRLRRRFAPSHVTDKKTDSGEVTHDGSALRLDKIGK